MTAFDIVKRDFWGKGTYGLLSPVTDAVIVAAEQTLGVTLPAELLELLRIQNGGAVSDRFNVLATSTPTSWVADHVAFDLLSGIGSGSTGPESITDTPHLVSEWGLPSPVVLRCGDGHYWIALDYRTCGPNGIPSVVWLDTEVDQDIPLAPSFRDFIERLGPQRYEEDSRERDVSVGDPDPA